MASTPNPVRFEYPGEGFVDAMVKAVIDLAFVPWVCITGEASIAEACGVRTIRAVCPFCEIQRQQGKKFTAMHVVLKPLENKHTGRSLWVGQCDICSAVLWDQTKHKQRRDLLEDPDTQKYVKAALEKKGLPPRTKTDPSPSPP